MPDRTIFVSNDYNSYKYDAPASGLVGPHVASGLIWDNAKMKLTNEFDGIEKITEYDVKGNVIQGTGTATYRKYDA